MFYFKSRDLKGYTMGMSEIAKTEANASNKSKTVSVHATRRTLYGANGEIGVVPWGPQGVLIAGVYQPCYRLSGAAITTQGISTDG
jgi:hypothetical protein